MTDGTAFEHGVIPGVMWVLVEIAALNWALVEFADTNLVTKVLGTGQGATIAYGAIGLVAVLALADSFGAYDLREADEVLGGGS